MIIDGLSSYCKTGSDESVHCSKKAAFDILHIIGRALLGHNLLKSCIRVVHNCMIYWDGHACQPYHMQSSINESCPIFRLLRAKAIVEIWQGNAPYAYLLVKGHTESSRYSPLLKSASRSDINERILAIF